MYSRKEIAAALTEREIKFDEEGTDAELAQQLVAALEADGVEVAKELEDIALSDEKQDGKGKTKAKATAKPPAPPKEKDGTYTMLNTIKHDTVEYKKGETHDLPADLVKEFKKQGVIK